jgi:hypothetical protein
LQPSNQLDRMPKHSGYRAFTVRLPQLSNVDFRQHVAAPVPLFLRRHS